MSLYERESRGYFRAARVGRTCNPPRNHIKEVDPESFLDDPVLPHRVVKITLEELINRRREAVNLGKQLDLLYIATPEDIRNRMREQMMRRFKLQKSGKLGYTWKQRKNPSKRSSY